MQTQGMKNGEATSSQGLGWLSIGLGLAELAAPRGFTRFVGIGDPPRERSTTLAVGVREILTGLGILAMPRSSAFLWARVAGDVMDLVLLGRSLESRRADRSRVLASMAAVAGVLVVDGLAAARRTGERTNGRARSGSLRDGIHVVKSITINRSPEDIYAFWRELRNLPRFMAHLESVHEGPDGRSRWRAKASAGTEVEWEAVIVIDRPGEMIAWRSIEGSAITNAGSVRFMPAPGGRGTEIHVDLRYRTPAGRIGTAIAKRFGEEPSLQIEGDLRRLKQVMETGEIMRSDASVHRGMHPARPSRNLSLENGR